MSRIAVHSMSSIAISFKERDHLRDEAEVLMVMGLAAINLTKVLGNGKGVRSGLLIFGANEWEW